MNNFIERNKLLILGIIIIISGIVIETNVFDRRFGKNQARSFETVLNGKIQQTKLLLGEIKTVIENDNTPLSEKLETYISANQLLLEDRGIIFAIFHQNELLFWSDNKASFSDTYRLPSLHYSSLKIGHGWYFLQQERMGDTVAVALNLIKTEYPYENAFLEDAFHHDFNLTPEVSLSSVRLPGYYSIYDTDGKYLISLDAKPVRNSNPLQRGISILLYLIGILIILLFTYRSLQKLQATWKYTLGNIAVSVFILLARWAMYAYRIPYIFHSSALFDPTYFAASEILSSLGDLFINTLILVLFSAQASFILRRLDIRLNKWFGMAAGVIYSSLSLVMLLSIMNIVDTLVQNSSIVLEPYKILQINHLSFIAYLTIAFLFYSFLIIQNSLIKTFKKSINKNTIIIITNAITLAAIITSATGKHSFSFWQPIIYSVLAHCFIYVHYINREGFSFRLKVPVVILISIFTVGFIQNSITEKKKNIKRIYAENLENEQDPVAEILLSEVESKLKRDNFLFGLIRSTEDAEKSVTPYLQKKYFGGFLGKYDLKTTICRNGKRTKQHSTNNQPCEKYFDGIIKTFGSKVSGSNFHFINNKDGSISYLLMLKKNRTRLYIELSSKFTSEELGYPELLLDHTISGNKVFSDFSFAKYKHGKLITQKGDYSYSISDGHFIKALEKTGRYFNYDDYDHYIFKANTHLTIVISSKETRIFDKIISFSYTFLFLFLLVVIGEIFIIAHSKISYSGLNFKLKIQFAIVGVLLISLMLIGASLIILNKNEYINAQYVEVNEKINSVLVELENKLDGRDTITNDDKEYIAFLLNKYSSVFFADMHIYDLHGKLYASSRPEVFKHGLVGNQINHDAYYALHNQNKVSYMHEENIGEMQFLSSYALLKNKQNKGLAYINLPYFTKQTILSDRLSSLAAALINIFVLMLLLSVAIAIFIANKVTYPLQLLKTKISSVSLGSKNEVINWESNDEIGNLITDYNRMVNELEESAEKLAESERLQAWHQMAKQVAHEIKNPLTPMKLNIQFLKRAWDNKDEKFDERLNKTAASLIEQIDALANTANEFSNFSQYSKDSLTEVDVAPLLDHACLIFSNTSSAEIITVFSEKQSLFVRADKEKLLRVFNNLIKNALQSIPKDRQGEVIISLRKEEDNVLIIVHDNGKGISPEQQSKLFRPNFTTKSSGMGLGLGIVKNILDSIGGKIWFESKINIGTRFFIQLPLIKKEQ